MPRMPFKAIALAGAVSIGALAMSHDPAEAGRRHGGGVAAAAIAGIALGAIIAGSASRRTYYEPNYYYAPPPPPPPRYYAPPVAYRSYAPPPWTREWYAYCSRKYVSFDPASGTYQPYHGPRRLCR